MTRRLLSQGRSLEEIAAERELALSTIVGHVEALADAGDELKLNHLMPAPDRAAEIRSAFHAAGTLMLSPVRDLLSEDYSYEELRLVRLDLRRAEPSADRRRQGPLASRSGRRAHHWSSHPQRRFFNDGTRLYLRRWRVRRSCRQACHSASPPVATYTVRALLSHRHRT